MSAHYDNFDYPSYWNSREYEHKSELLAITSFLTKIKDVGKVLDIGSGYGRLTSTYIHRCKKAILLDPSYKLLSIAYKKYKSRKITLLHTRLENSTKKLYRNSIDLVLMVRVLHHIKKIDYAFSLMNKVLKRKGYLILEFPNKNHTKALFKEFFRGNFTAFFDIFPKDIRSRDNILDKSISFNNFHPGYIVEILRERGFNIIEVRSVSNIRSRFLKRHFPLSILLFVEKYMQLFLSYIYFGPSTFVLAQKR